MRSFKQKFFSQGLFKRGSAAQGSFTQGFFTQQRFGQVVRNRTYQTAAVTVIVLALVGVVALNRDQQQGSLTSNPTEALEQGDAQLNNTQPTKPQGTSTKSADSVNSPQAVAPGGGTSPGRFTTWYSGASGDQPPAQFGAARGEPVSIIGLWADLDAHTQSLGAVTSATKQWDGAMSIAVGGLTPGETWEKAANGAYDSRWKTAARTLASFRTGKPPTFVSIAHEMNGNWFTWTVTKKNLASYKKAWQRYVKILRAELPEVYIVFPANAGTHTDVSVDEIWPGDAWVDVVGISYYGTHEFPGATQKVWDETYTRIWNDSPLGLGMWHEFAKSHGKPIGFPEWGLNGNDKPTSDMPVYIKNMNKFMSQNAMHPGANPAGKVVFDTYFNVDMDGNKKWLIASNPKSAALYKCLKWGGTGKDTYPKC